MPVAYEYVCEDCNNEDFIVAKILILTPFPQKWFKGPPASASADERIARRREIEAWTAAHVVGLVCDACYLELELPTAIDRESWTEWKAHDAAGSRPYTRYPFLVALADRIDAALTASEACVLEWGGLTCPYCARALEIKPRIALRCARCQSSNTRITGSGLASMGPGFPQDWPPIV